MYLADVDIRAALERQEIVIRDFEEKRLQPASYDILLGNRFIVNDDHTTHYIDPSRGVFARTREILVPDGEEFVLHPGVSVLGCSKDYFGSDRFLIQLGGKSSLARVGLMVHNTAGLINPGHYLQITLELCNLNSVPIILRPGMAIGQLLFAHLSSVPAVSYCQIGRFARDNWANFAPEMVARDDPLSTTSS
ncbi:MAG: dCTP deaminase [Chlamydiia bacterium]